MYIYIIYIYMSRHRGGLSPVEVATPFFGGRQRYEERREKRGFHHEAVQNLEKQAGGQVWPAVSSPRTFTETAVYSVAGIPSNVAPTFITDISFEKQHALEGGGGHEVCQRRNNPSSTAPLLTS